MRRRVDTRAASYLGDLLVAVQAHNAPGAGLQPIHVEADGNCLSYAVSRALYGDEARPRPRRPSSSGPQSTMW